MKKNIYFSILGLSAGILNGLFGAGGGMIVVPFLEYAGIDPKKSHATSIAIIFLLSFISCVFYYFKGSLFFLDAFSYLPAGVIGAVCGAILLKKMPKVLLKRLFGLIMIFSALRLLLK